MRTIWSMIILVGWIFIIGFIYKNCSYIREYEDNNKITIPQVIGEQVQEAKKQFTEFYIYIQERYSKEY